MHQLAMAYEIWMSFEKCLFEEQGYDSVELIRSV